MYNSQHFEYSRDSEYERDREGLPQIRAPSRIFDGNTLPSLLVVDPRKIPIAMEHSGYSKNFSFNPAQSTDYRLKEPPHPMVARRIRRKDPVEGENEARGPAMYSTSYGCGVAGSPGFYVDPVAPRENIGTMELSGFTRNNRAWVQRPDSPDDEEERARLGIKLHRWELGGTSKQSNMKNSFKPLPFHADYSKQYGRRALSVPRSRSAPVYES